jgi:hypothetical protein
MTPLKKSPPSNNQKDSWEKDNWKIKGFFKYQWKNRWKYAKTLLEKQKNLGECYNINFFKDRYAPKTIDNFEPDFKNVWLSLTFHESNENHWIGKKFNNSKIKINSVKKTFAKKYNPKTNSIQLMKHFLKISKELQIFDIETIIINHLDWLHHDEVFINKPAAKETVKKIFRLRLNIDENLTFARKRLFKYWSDEWIEEALYQFILKF